MTRPDPIRSDFSGPSPAAVLDRDLHYKVVLLVDRQGRVVDCQSHDAWRADDPTFAAMLRRRKNVITAAILGASVVGPACLVLGLWTGAV